MALTFLGQRYPELTERIRQKYGVGVGAMIIDWGDPNRDGVEELLEDMVAIGNYTGQMQALEKAGLALAKLASDVPYQTINSGHTDAANLVAGMLQELVEPQEDPDENQGTDPATSKG